jgi:hypothetical protein
MYAFKTSFATLHQHTANFAQASLTAPDTHSFIARFAATDPVRPFPSFALPPFPISIFNSISVTAVH